MNMTTLRENQNNENKDLIFPLLKTTENNSNQISNNNNNIENSINILIENHILKPITISFDNINYVIQNKQLFHFYQKLPTKQILTNISGIFPPGMNAILGRIFLFTKKKSFLFLLGPTGCGKSTLLDILADRKDHQGLSGNIYVSGHIRPKYFRHMIGYVIQDGKEIILKIIF